LRPPLFTPGGQETLNRLGDPPALPRTTRAMLDARYELTSQSFERRSGHGFIVRLAHGESILKRGFSLPG
jgi:hypothetical protein